MDKQNETNKSYPEREASYDDKLILSDSELKKIVDLFDVFIDIDRRNMRKKGEEKN